jgi:hypothetical protein
MIIQDSDHCPFQNKGHEYNPGPGITAFDVNRNAQHPQLFIPPDMVGSTASGDLIRSAIRSELRSVL